MYDQLWIKRGRPEKIQIVELDLKCSESEYLRSIIFGNPGQSQFDGVHLRGSDSERHFTYRAVQSIKPVLKQVKSNKPNYQPNCGNDCPQQRFQRKQTNQSQPDSMANTRANQSPVFDNQTWQFPRIHQSQAKRGNNRDYANVVKKGNNSNNGKQPWVKQGVPTSNY